MHPLSNLIASDQVRGGDLIKVDFDTEMGCLVFMKEAEDLPAYAMVQMMDTAPAVQTAATAAVARNSSPPGEPTRRASARVNPGIRNGARAPREQARRPPTALLSDLVAYLLRDLMERAHGDFGIHFQMEIDVIFEPGFACETFLDAGHVGNA